MKKTSKNKRCWIVDDDNICHSGWLHYASLSAVIQKILPELKKEYEKFISVEYYNLCKFLSLKMAGKNEEAEKMKKPNFISYLEKKYGKEKKG